MFDTAVADELRHALSEARYTAGAVHQLLGDAAHAALLRNETTPAARVAADDTPLSVLTRLFALQQPVAAAVAEIALPGLLEPLYAAEVLERREDGVRARVDIRPYGDETHDWWVVCDLTPGLDGRKSPLPGDHVLGIGEASISLAQLSVREPVGSALDLGAGCGVQSLHLSTHSDRVVGTDVNPRALAMARATARLNGIDLDVREGSLYEPVADDAFDLIVTNPPFVIAPATGERLVYRESGLPGDDVVRRIVTDGPRYLRPGGRLQVLGNWVQHRGTPWQDRIADWVADTGCDAWVLQREVVDPPTYVELWLSDAGLRDHPDYTRRYDAWLSWLDDQDVEAIGFGWMFLRRTDRAQPYVRLEEWPHDVEQPLAPQIAAWGAAADYAQLADDALLNSRLTQVGGLQQEELASPGVADPERIVIRQLHGLRRARQVDTVEAGLIGACDGELTIAQILDALAQLLSVDAVQLRESYLVVVRELLVTGYLRPAM